MTYAEQLESRVLLSASLVKDIDARPVETDAKVLGRLGNVVLLSAKQGDTNINSGESFDAEPPTLYRTDGTFKGSFKLGGGDSPRLIAQTATFVVYQTGSAFWRTDGTVKGTFKLGKFHGIQRGAVLGNSILFVANDSPDIYSLWKTDGTVAGTVRLTKNLGRDALLGDMVAFNGFVYFLATVSGKGVELGRSDGTVEGTTLFADLAPGPTSSRPRRMVTTSDRLYFVDKIDNATTEHLWSTDGTTVKLLQTVDTPDGIKGLHALGDTLYFAEDEDATVPDLDSVWRVNAQAGSLKRLKQIDQPAFAGIDRDGGSFDRLYLTDHGTSQQPRRALYVLRGDTISLLKSDTADQPFTSLKQTGNDLYFAQSFSDSGGNFGQQLSRTDGTSNGTVILKKITGAQAISQINTAGSNVFFTTSAEPTFAQYPVTLWKTDGTASGTQDLFTGTFYNAVKPDPSSSVAIGNTLYFSNPGPNRDVFKSDGTPSGTRNLRSAYANTHSSNPADLTNGVGGFYFNTLHDLYIHRDDGSVDLLLDFNGQVVGQLGNKEVIAAGKSLYLSDGTQAGTKAFFTSSAYLGHAALVGSTIYFENQGDLWKSDGTSNGTVKIKAGLKMVQSIAFGKTLAFVTDNGSEQQLWRTDGTAGGTILLGHNISQGSQLAVYKGLVFFFTFNRTDHTLWRTDGTVDGTHKLKSGLVDYPNSLQFLLAGQVLYFSGSQMIWTTDGTGAGTVPLKPPSSGLGFGGFVGAAGIGNRIYFAGGDSVHGGGLWTSMGTSKTTVLVKAVNPNAIYYTYDDKQVFETVRGAAAGGNFYFSVEGKLTDEGRSYQLWKTDGSPSGTVAVTKVAGPDGLSPRDLLVRNNTLFFGGEDTRHGRELWQFTLA